MVLLLHFNGTDGANSARDWSNSEHAMTFGGSGEISTDQQKFGTASLYTPGGSSDYVECTIDNDFDFGTGDFTIDFWVYFNSTSGYQCMVEAGSYNNGVMFRADNATTATLYIDGTDTSISWSRNTDQWYHVAIVRSGSTAYIFIDGTEKTSFSNSDDIDCSGSTDFRIGSATHTTGQTIDGYIDEFRVLNGRAAWTSNFTPPTQEYKNAAASSSSST